MALELASLRQLNIIRGTRPLFTATFELVLLYPYQSTREPGRPALLRCYQALLAPIRERVTHYGINETTNFKKIKRDTFDLFPYAMDHEDEGIGDLVLLRGPEAWPDLFFQWYDSDTGYFRLCLPIEDVLTDLPAYVAMCQEAAAQLPFSFGMAGFSMNYEDIYLNGHEEVWAAPIMARFPGVNLLHPRFYWRAIDDLPTMNWLTFVRADLVERLGGIDAMRSAAGPQVTIYPMAHGALVQAGPEPLLGDVNRQETMDAYYQAGAMLAPVKSTEGWSSNLGGGDYEAGQWLHRFFREAPR